MIISSVYTTLWSLEVKVRCSTFSFHSGTTPLKNWPLLECGQLSSGQFLETQIHQCLILAVIHQLVTRRGNRLHRRPCSPNVSPLPGVALTLYSLTVSLSRARHDTRFYLLFRPSLPSLHLGVNSHLLRQKRRFVDWRHTEGRGAVGCDVWYSVWQWPFPWYLRTECFFCM